MKRAASSLVIIAFLYFALLLWGDFRKLVVSELPRLLTIMPMLLGFCLLSVGIRFLRWRWLFKRAGININSHFLDFLNYISGFAFTATPGKVGELIRVRYYAPMGVPASRVVSAFIFERMFDLIAVLILSCLAISHKDMLIPVLLFVLIFVVVIIVLIANVPLLTRISHLLTSRNFTKLADLCDTLLSSLTACRIWANPLDISISLLAGLLAWGVQSVAFIILLNHLGISIPVLPASAIFPLAMLVGAASMLPGGLGSAEAAITFLLSYYGAEFTVAMLATVGLRVSTIWFSILLGILAILFLETKLAKTKTKNQDEN